MKQTIKKNQSLAITSNEEVNALGALDALKAELSQLKIIKESTYRTSGLYGSVDIKDSTSVSELIKIFGEVCGKKAVYDQAQAELGITSAPTFTTFGGSKDDWKEDIKLRIAIITTEDRRKELEDLVKEGQNFISEKQQFELYMKRVQKVISK